MPIEGSRGCGYRKVGGLYLVGGNIWDTCDRLKLEIPVCGCCGETLRPNRGIQPINAFKLFGDHQHRVSEGQHDMDTEFVTFTYGSCSCNPNCRVCYPVNWQGSLIPPERQASVAKDFILWIGRQFYDEQSFSAEATLMGISRRIPHIPDGLVIGSSVIYLAMRNNMRSQTAVGADGRPIMANGIFMAFRPQRLEYLLWQSEATEERLEELRSHNITPVVVPDGDDVHRPTRRTSINLDNIPSNQTGEGTLARLFDGL